MKPIAILSVDRNPDYLALLPIVCRSWELQGFHVWVNINTPIELDRIECVLKYLSSCKCIVDPAEPIQGTRNQALYSQCIRMYMPKSIHITTSAVEDRYCILSDVDMFIGSSFLYRDFDKVNSFGHDLTGFGHIPMCYVGMTASKWREVMKYHPGNSMMTDLQTYADIGSEQFEKYWGADQDILTGKLREYGFDKVNFINRGHDPENDGLPIGRWDRHNWKKPSCQIHDVHLMRNPLSDENFPKIVEMCNTIYPGENWEWLVDFRNDFLKS